MLIPTLIVAGLIALVAIAYFVSYNRFVAQTNLVAESWKQIDVELQRRFDLIPNLVATVKGYAKHEQETLAQVIAARNAAGEHRATVRRSGSRSRPRSGSRSGTCSGSPSPTPTSRRTRTTCSCRRNCPTPKTGSLPGAASTTATSGR